MRFRIREGGKEHVNGDPNCPACQSPDEKHWPQLHQDAVSSCLGLVHVERFPENIKREGASVVYRCDQCEEENPT